MKKRRKANCFVVVFVTFSHKLEVQADVSTSETASAVTCVSDKSGNTQNDNASTKALAGSVYRQVWELKSYNIPEYSLKY